MISDPLPTERRPQQQPVWATRPARGRESIAAVCRELFDDIDRLTTLTDAVVDAEIAEFRAPDGQLPEPDRFLISRRLIASFLQGVAEDRGLSEEEMEYLRLLGERTAKFGFPLQPMIASFNVKCRELWSHLVEKAASVGGPAPLQLLGSGVTIWERLHAATSALAEGYGDEMGRQEALETRTTAHFLEALTGDAGSDECRSLAAELGFEPDGRFRSVVLVGPIVSVDTARLVAAACHRRGAIAVSAPRGRSAVLVCQGIDRSGLERCLELVPPGTPIGVGLEGDRLEGAHASLHEAEGVLELAAMRGVVCHFEDDWFLAGALAHRSTVERILSHGIEVAVENPHLADAMRTFAESEFSLTRTAEHLHLSQSAVGYRLRRWHALTGWNPWSPRGIASALMALELARTRSSGY